MAKQLYRLLMGILCLAPTILSAQNSKLILQPGSDLTVTGGNMVLYNTDLSAGGVFDASGATVSVRGSNNTSLGGAGTPVIQTLILNTSPATTLTLGTTLNISSALDFQNGLIDLSGNQLQLTGNGILQSEGETSHITGTSGGLVTASASAVNSPNQLNIGNLGAVLTSAANLGLVTISRSHKPATDPHASSMHGIQRTFLITPQHNAALNATLRFYYLDAELAGDDASTLSLWKSLDGVNWTQIGADSRNTTSKYVEKTGLADLSYWTLTDIANPLPLTLLSFKAGCEDTHALLQWQTGSESGIDHFIIESSSDGTVWSPLGAIAATNNPNGADYQYKDDRSSTASYYRLEIVGQSGSITYSPVFRGSCGDITLPFMVYPNPAHGQTTAQVAVREAASATLQLFTMTGQLLYVTQWQLQPGINQYLLPVGGLAPGAYVVKLQYKGALLETQLTKQ